MKLIPVLMAGCIRTLGERPQYGEFGGSGIAMNTVKSGVTARVRLWPVTQQRSYTGKLLTE